MTNRPPYIVSNEEAKESKRFFKIPGSILEIVLVQKLFAPFRLFMYFKTVSTNGQMRICPKVIALAAADLKISEKSVKRHLNILVDRNWVGRFTSGGYIIRSFDKLRKIEKTVGRTAVWFDAQKHLNSFQEYVIASCITVLISKQRTKLWKAQELPGSRRGKPIERKSSAFPTFYPIACEAMKQIYGISIGTAYNWKQAAHKAGFITVKKILRPTNVNNGQEARRANPEWAHRIIMRDNKYYIQYPDKVESYLKLTRRRSTNALDKY